MAKKEKSKLRELIAEYGIKDLKDVHEFVKALTAETIQEVLEGELENELGVTLLKGKGSPLDPVIPLFSSFYALRDIAPS